MVIEELNELLTLLSNIHPDIYTLTFVIVILFSVIFLKIVDDKKHRLYYDSMLEEKNKEIERLAEDNRMYRDKYLMNNGFSKEQIDNMTAANYKGE